MDKQEKLSFDPRIHQKELFQAWKDFVTNGKLNRNIVRPMIAESWIRSRQNGVNPWDIPDSAYLTEKEFANKIENSRFLIDIAKPFMQNIHQSLAGSNYVMVLDDPDGYLLLRIGTMFDSARAQKFKIKLGLCRDEKTLGTTGYSLVKKHSKAIQIVGCEHYNALFHFVVGSYAPIKHPNDENKLLGVIGVAGAQTFANDQNLALASATAKAIENLLGLHLINNVLSVYGNALQTTIDSMAEGILIIDHAGMIYELNETAKKIFKIANNKVKGKHISEAIGHVTLEDSVMKILRDQDKTGEEVELSVNGRKYLTTVKFAEDQTRGVWGVVVFLKDLKHLTKLAKGLSENGLRFTLYDMVGQSGHMANIKEFVSLVAPGESNIVIEGESGTGKEVLAQVIHSASPRMKEPFVAVNCLAIPSELFESIFFGHEKGAFTNAYRTNLGKFELADKGTIFLDEIADMPLGMQAKLLRVLEERKIERVGGHERIDVDVRVIAATNRDLAQEVLQGRFRRDLFYRLNVFRIKLPPLRERKEDIPLLIDYFIEQFTNVLNKPIKRILPEFCEKLMEYDWPGNIRELKNAVHNAVTVMENGVLSARHLSIFFQQISYHKSVSGEGDAISAILERGDSRPKNLFAIEKEAIAKTLALTRGNKRQAAIILGIGRTTLYQKIKEYGIKETRDDAKT